MRTLAFVCLFLLCGMPAHSVTPTTVTTKKKKRKKHYRPAVVHVSPAVRQAALRAIDQRTVQSAQPVEDAGALVPFFEQLSHPPETGSLHILQFGDSHTASDDWANAMRESFQRKFGAGGPGFTLPGHPFLGYRRFDSRGSNSRGWYTGGVVTRPGDGIDGLSGISLTAHAAGQTISLTVECEQLELHFLKQPGGGQVEFSVDGISTDTIDTAGEFAAGVYQYMPSSGPHEYTLRTLSADPVRIFGWVAENRSGVTYETLGINGAEANLMLAWNADIFSSELTGREPALIVLAYGTNEALSRKWTSEEYRTALTEIVQRLRAAAPLASILIVGPPDCEHRIRGRRVAFPHLDEVIDIQRAVAQERGCAFWDWRAAMGGPGSRRQWVQAGLSQADYTHLTGAGYRLLGDTLFAVLMNQYDRFLQIRAQETNGQ